MTRNEAIERINDVLNSEYHYDETLGYQLTSDDIEWLEKAKEALQERRWISVREKPPEESGKYLVCTERGNVYQTKFYSYPESKGGHWGQKDKGRSITHWMRLPEAPNAGGNK